MTSSIWRLYASASLANSLAGMRFGVIRRVGLIRIDEKLFESSAEKFDTIERAVSARETLLGVVKTPIRSQEKAERRT